VSTEMMKGPIQSVSRAAAILRCFYEREDLGLQEISDLVGLHKSTTATLVTTLKNEKLLEQDPATSRYRLGLGAFLLGANVKMDLRSLTLPYLDSLNRRFMETVNLAVADGRGIIYVNKIESEYSMRTCTRIGQRLPFYCTANGKAIFANYSNGQLDRVLDGLVLQPVSPRTHATVGALRRDLEEIRERGYAWDDEELELGLCCCAVPLFDSAGLPAGAISVSGPAIRMKHEEKADVVPALLECARQVNELLRRSNYVTARISDR